MRLLGDRLGQQAALVEADIARGRTDQPARFDEPSGLSIAADKLFEPFASGRPGGLGLGLYQARKSLNEAGGELRAEPSEAGLRFLLRMPAQAP